MTYGSCESWKVSHVRSHDWGKKGENEDWSSCSFFFSEYRYCLQIVKPSDNSHEIKLEISDFFRKAVKDGGKKKGVAATNVHPNPNCTLTLTQSVPQLFIIFQCCRHYVGNRYLMLVTCSWCWWRDLSSTSQTCHLYIWSPTSVTNIEPASYHMIQ